MNDLTYCSFILLLVELSYEPFQRNLRVFFYHFFSFSCSHFLLVIKGKKFHQFIYFTKILYVLWLLGLGLRLTFTWLSLQNHDTAQKLLRRIASKSALMRANQRSKPCADKNRVADSSSICKLPLPRDSAHNKAE